MNLITIILIIIFFLVLILIGISLKYPKGRNDWPLDRKTTAAVFLSIFIFVFVIILSFYASQFVNWPSKSVIIFYSGVIIFAILIVFAILLPKGMGQTE